MSDPTRRDDHPIRLPVVAVPDRTRLASPLPAPRGSFVGRTKEMDELRLLCGRSDVRLVTLTGPGGAGKTRVALRLAAELEPGYADGAAFIPLAALPRADLVLPAIAQVLGVRQSSGGPLSDQLVIALRDAHFLVIFDNFEHVVAAAAIISTVLNACPAVTVLVTSRTPLRLAGEQVYPIPPMAVPEAGTPLPELAEADSIQLFADRARAAVGGFQLTAANAPDVARICQRVDGLPLAIELAAARVTALPPAALLARLERRLPLLTGGPRDVPDRLRTMRDAIAWSYDLLTPADQAVFRHLGVFAGGFDLAAVAAILPPAGDQRDQIDILDHVSKLIAHSLIRQQAEVAGEPCFGMLETIREFSLDQLAARDETESARRRHAAYFLMFVNNHSSVPPLPGEARRMAVVAAVHDNTRLALDWFDQHGGAEELLMLAGSLFEHWFTSGLFSEGRYWLERALAKNLGLATAARLRALSAAMSLAQFQGDLAAASEIQAEELPLARRLGDPHCLLTALIGGSLLAYHQGRYAAAASLTEEAIQVVRTVITDDGLSLALTGVLLGMLAKIAFGRGLYDESAERCQAALPLLREAGHHWAVADQLTDLAAVRYCQGVNIPAAALVVEAFDTHGQSMDPRTVSGTVLVAAGVLAARGDFQLAARLCGAADAVGLHLALPSSPRDRIIQERCLRALVPILSEHRMASEQTVGRRWPIGQAAREAHAAIATILADQPSAPASGSTLTWREREVLSYVAGGLTDREIADTLYISPRTVNTHMTHILTKLGVSTRRQAAVRARKLGIVPASDPADNNS